MGDTTLKRNSAPFSYYLRTATRKLNGSDSNNVLALSAAGEAMFMYKFVLWADADRTTYS